MPAVVAFRTLLSVVEKWLPIERRRDLFGIGDVLGVHPRGEFLLVQCTSASNVSARVAKARSTPELATWLKAGGRFEVWGWKGPEVKRVVRDPEVVPITECPFECRASRAPS